MTYKTFKRSCRNWNEFSSGRKITDETGLSYEQAKQRCNNFNSNLTSRQKRKGTKMEFTAE
jgi:hypothetical protein